MPDPTALFPTPTRLALLRDVDAGRIRRVTIQGVDDYARTRDLRRVTARIDELTHAGWVELDPHDIAARLGSTFQGYRLTAIGRQVLADA